MAGLWVVHTADKIQQMWVVVQAMADLAKRHPHHHHRPHTFRPHTPNPRVPTHACRTHACRTTASRASPVGTGIVASGNGPVSRLVRGRCGTGVTAEVKAGEVNA